MRKAMIDLHHSIFVDPKSIYKIEVVFNPIFQRKVNKASAWWKIWEHSVSSSLIKEYIVQVWIKESNEPIKVLSTLSIDAAKQYIEELDNQIQEQGKDTLDKTL